MRPRAHVQVEDDQGAQDGREHHVQQRDSAVAAAAVARPVCPVRQHGWELVIIVLVTSLGCGTRVGCQELRKSVCTSSPRRPWCYTIVT